MFWTEPHSIVGESNGMNGIIQKKILKESRGINNCMNHLEAPVA